jgi:hypothetical protein
MNTTYHFDSISEVNQTVLENFKNLHKNKAVTIIISDEKIEEDWFDKLSSTHKSDIEEGLLDIKNNNTFSNEEANILIENFIKSQLK